MSLGPSCTEHSRAYHRALDSGIEVENEHNIGLWSTDEYPFHSPPSAWRVVPPVNTISDQIQIDLFGQKIALTPSLWVDTIAACECVYCCLHHDALEDIEQAFLNANSDKVWAEDCINVLRRSRDWKYDSGSEAAIKHEAEFACTFGLDNPIRGKTEDEKINLLEETSDNQKRAISRIRELSLDILEFYFSFPLTLYRGIGYHLRSVAEEVFSDPTKSTYFCGEWECVMSNFTPDSEIGCNFSEVLFQVKVGPDAILFAPDFLTHTVVYYHNDGVWRLVTEGEIRLATDELEDFDREEICVARASDSSLVSAIESIPTSITAYDGSTAPLFSPDQHRAIREAALSFATFTIDNGKLTLESVSPPEAEKAAHRIQTWFSIYEEEFTPNPSIDHETDHIAEIIREIVTGTREG